MNEDHQISERGRALILAAAVLERPNADPDDDLAVLARQLTRAQEEIDGSKPAPASKPTCRWCGDDNNHGGMLCPYVQALEFEKDGTWSDDGRPNVFVSRVEFLTPADFGKVRDGEVEAPAPSYPRFRPTAA